MKNKKKINNTSIPEFITQAVAIIGSPLTKSTFLLEQR